MPHSRLISWSNALRNLRADRITLAPGERRALCREQGFMRLAAGHARASQVARSLATISGYDRPAIMSVAIASSKARRSVTGETWNVCLLTALKGTWQVAKYARRVVLSLGQYRAEHRRGIHPSSVASSIDSAAGEGRQTRLACAPLGRAMMPASPQGFSLRWTVVLAERTHFVPAGACGRLPDPHQGERRI